MTATTDKVASQDSTGGRLTGLARVLEAETWRTAAVMHDAAFEAERLCNDIYQAVYEAYQPTGDSTAAKVAASDSIRSKADEALRLLRKAENCLIALTGSDQPPF